MTTFLFIVEIILIVTALFLVAYLPEKALLRKENRPMPVITTKKIAMTGVFSAISGVLMLLEIPLAFAPPFYKLDISEVPVLILAFAYGPVAGVLCEFLKVVIKLVLKGTTSAFVGELANFIIGCAFLLPAGFAYLARKTKSQALIGCILGTITMTAVGSFLNGIYLLPKFAEIYGMPLEKIVAMGTAINPTIDSVLMLIFLCVVPMNLLKGVVDTVLTMLLYKRLSKVIKNDRNRI